MGVECDPDENQTIRRERAGGLVLWKVQSLCGAEFGRSPRLRPLEMLNICAIA